MGYFADAFIPGEARLYVGSIACGSCGCARLLRRACLKNLQPTLKPVLQSAVSGYQPKQTDSRHLAVGTFTNFTHTSSKQNNFYHPNYRRTKKKQVVKSSSTRFHFIENVTLTQCVLLTMNISACFELKIRRYV